MDQMAEFKSGAEKGLILVRGEEHTVLSVRDLVATGFQHKKWIVSCFCGVLLLAVAAAIALPRQYESEAKIMVNHLRADPQVTAGAETQSVAREGLITNEEVNSEVELMRSEDLLRKVAVTCGLAPSGDAPEQQLRLAGALAVLRSRLKVEAINKTNIIQVAYSSPNPELSRRIVNTVLDLYIEKHVAAHSMTGQFEFFDQQVDQYRRQLEEAEAALRQFSEQQGGLVLPGVQRDALLQRQNEFTATLQQTRAAIAETEERIGVLTKEARTTAPRITTQLRRADNPQLLQDLHATLLKLELQRTQLLSKYQPTYRPVQEAEAEIAETKTAIASAESSPVRDTTTDVNPTQQWIDSELTKARADLRSLQSRAAKMVTIVQNYDQQAHIVNSKELQHQDLARNTKTAEENYLLYVRKREEARISNALDQRRILNVAVVEPATHPYLPKRSAGFYLFGGLLVAIVASAGLTFLLQQADHTFRTPQEVERFIEVPVLAAVPIERTLHSRLSTMIGSEVDE
jgi:uncharacterized protein involved in exopolysaccharide biosynthesis